MVMPELTISNGQIELAVPREIRYFRDFVRRYFTGITNLESFLNDAMRVIRVFQLVNGNKFFRIATEAGIVSELPEGCPEHIIEQLDRYTIFLSEDGRYDVYLPSWPDSLMAKCRDSKSKFLREFTPQRLVRFTKCLLPLSRDDCIILADILVPQIRNYNGIPLTIEIPVHLNFFSLFDSDFYERITFVESSNSAFTCTNTYTNFTEILFSRLQYI